MVRQFKHHEQKLLKKVDFLNVRPFSLNSITSLYLSFEITLVHSGNKMRTYEKSKS